LGYGEMGHAMQHLLAPVHDLTIWERSPRDGRAPLALESVAAGRDFVLFCVPTPPHVDLARRLLPLLPPTSICLSIAKGLDDAGRTAAQAFDQVLGPDRPHGVLYGPMIAEEMRAGRPAFAQLAINHATRYSQVADLFRTSGLHITASSDRHGIAWSAVLKNVYAILFGIADEMQLGDNVRGYLAANAIAEIATLMAARGGAGASAYGWAGLGDLVTTATSAGSHHHALGRLLVRGQRDAIRGEGVHSVYVLQCAATLAWERYPLLSLVRDCINDPDSVRSRMRAHLDGL
jgi:glycerol-3-phosphate dehydrogenase (NAD(P)+)